MRYLPLVLALLLAAASAVCGYLAYSAKPPLLEPVGDGVFDAGTAEQEKTISASFTLRNTSGRMMTIKGVRKGCRCQEVRISHEEVAPWAEVKVKVEWSLKGLRGEVEQPLWVFYQPEGGTGGVAELGLRARVIPEYDLTPERLIFHPDKSGTATVIFKPRPGKEVKLMSAYASHESFTVEVRQDPPRVEVTYDSGARHHLRPNDPPKVEVMTSSVDEPLRKIPILFEPK